MTTLFFPPNWPRWWWTLHHLTPLASRAVQPHPPNWRHRIGFTLALLYLTIQCALPFRAYLYPGHVLWTEEGMQFGWRVMLAEKTGHVEFAVREPQTARVWRVSPRDYLTQRQAKMMATRPRMIRQLAQTIAQDVRQQGLGDVTVHANAYAALNGRPSQPLLDFEVDLMQDSETLATIPWIRPLYDVPPRRLHP